jgi:hypothetical protein
MSSDSMTHAAAVGCDASGPPSVEAQNPADNTTNGARSGKIILDWLVPIRKGEFSFAQIDRIIDTHDEDSELFNTLKLLLELTDEVVESICKYVKARRIGDFGSVASAMRALLENPSSPLYVIERPKAARGLPPPTVTVTTVPATPAPIDRFRAAARASQIIMQYAIEIFPGPAGETDGYYRWKFRLQDTLTTLKESPVVRMETTILALSPGLRLQVQNQLTGCLEDDLDRSCAAIFDYLDRCYATPHAIRSLEAAFYNCRMSPSESLQSYLTRYQDTHRLHERATGRILTERDKITGFMAGLTAFKTTAAIIDTIGCPDSFIEYAQKFLSLAKVSTQVVDMNAVETRSKRLRPDPDQGAATSNRHGFGCYRCSEKSHVALNCENEVLDFALRCHTCGSRRHKEQACTARINRNCRRCGGAHFESICPKRIIAQPKHTSNNAISGISGAEEVEKEEEKGVTEFDALQEMLCTDHNCVTIIDCGMMDIVDVSPPTVDVSVGGSPPTSALLDTGAGANFVHPDVVGDLFRQGFVEKADTFELKPPLRVRFGNGHEGETNAAIRMSIQVGDRNCVTAFAVYKNASPRFIIGRPGLRLLGLLQFNTGDIKANMKTDPHTGGASSAELFACTPEIEQPPSWIEPRPSDQDEGKQKLFVRFPLFEATMFEPVREQIRPRNELSERIILSRLRKMQSEGSVRSCELEDAPYVLPIVLIDKRAEERKPRLYPDEELHARYRITVDERGYNALTVHEIDGKAYLIPKELSSISKKSKRKVSQFQNSAYEILRHMPIKAAKYFTKIDLKDAYSSVYLPERMQHCAVEIYDRDENRHLYFRFTSLVQGWKYSPTFFRMASNFLVNECRKRIEAKFPMHAIFLSYFQDDIIAACDDRQKLIEATRIMVDTLKHFSFTVRDEKVQTATTELTFCGYKLQNYTACPTATRRKFSMDFASKLWNEFLSSYPENSTGIVSWLKSVTGCFQYLYGYLNPDGIQSLHKLYCHLRSLNEGKVPPIAEFEKPFRLLSDYVINGLPQFYVGAFPAEEVTASLLLADANADGWAGFLFKLVKLDGRGTREAPLDDIFEPVRSLLEIESKNGVFVPVRMYGGRFSKTVSKQSSTFRERVAQLLLLEESLELLQGKVISISDNKNVTQRWHDIEETFGGAMTNKWINFCQNVHETVWLPRDQLPSLADVAARIIAIGESSSTDSTAETSTGVQKAPGHLGGIPTDVNVPPVIEICSIANIPSLTTSIVIAELIRGYELDEETKYFGIPLADIYRAKLRDDGACKATHFFELDSNNLLWFLNAHAPRLYIPNVTSQQLGGVSVRAYLIRQAHCHSDLHFGVTKSLAQLDWAWWPCLNKDVMAFVVGCWVCITKKSRLVKSHFVTAISSTSSFVTSPFSVWFVDHFEFRERNFLLGVCGFSHFAFATQVVSIDALSTAVALVKLFSAFGLPSGIHSDQGPAFTSALLGEVNRLLRIDVSLSPPHFPRANGLCERVVGILKSLMSTSEASNIDVLLSMAIIKYNSSQSTKTNLSPYEAGFGITPRRLELVMLPAPCTTQFSYELQYSIRRMAATLTAEHLSHLQNESFLTSRISILKPGDLVYAVRSSPSGFKTIRVSGPYIALCRVSSNIWRCLKLSDSGSPASEEIPEAILKSLKTSALLQEFKDLIPPSAPGSVDDSLLQNLKTSEKVIVKSGDSAVLGSVASNDLENRKLVLHLWKQNQIGQFFRSETVKSVPYSDVVCPLTLTKERRIPEAVMDLLAYRANS